MPVPTHNNLGQDPQPPEGLLPVPQRVLVVGGGLIGAHVAAELAGAGSEVVVLSRSVSPWLQSASPAGSLRFVSGEVGRLRPDSEAAGKLDRLVADRDAVFMLAGRSTPAMASEDTVGSIVESLLPTLTLLESMRRTGTQRAVVATSGGTIYGRVEDVPTVESAPLRPISAHGVNSVATEAYAAFFARAHGLITTMLRFSNVYGPGQHQRRGFAVVAAWLEAAATGGTAQIVGDGTLTRDFVYARDAAHAAVLASRIPLGGSFNIGSGVETSLVDLLASVRRVTGTEMPVDWLPARPVDVDRTCLDTTRFSAATGWRAETGLDAGLRATWEWLTSSST